MTDPRAAFHPNVRPGVHLVVPEGVDDPTRPSGGNVYDGRIARGLAERGWRVVREETPSGALAARLAAVPDDALVLVDGLLASAEARAALAETDRLRVVPLVHLPFGTRDEGALLRACPAVLVTSRWTQRWLADRHGLDPARLPVAEPGVDIADPAEGTASGGELLVVGPVTHAKGHDVLLEALVELRDLDWRCTLVGSLDLDARFVDAVRSRCVDTGISDRVVFAGPRGHDEVTKAYAEADLLVVASRGETYAMVVTEALAHAVPVVASAVGGVPEALGHADDGSAPGTLVTPEDPDALAAALRAWLENPTRRRRLRRAAARRRLTLSTWTTTVRLVAETLEAVGS